MKLTKTLKVLKQIGSVSDMGHETDDALLVSNIVLVLKMLKMEAGQLPTDTLEPRLLLELSKFYQSIGDEHRALDLFQRATTFGDQNRGYYSDIGSCSVQLCRESTSEEFRVEVKSAIQRLLNVCPFRDDLKRSLGQI